MMAIAIAAFTFTACEDVPEPYNNPYDQLKNSNNGENVAAGEGSVENPFNAIAANQEALKLASGTVSESAYYIKGKVVSIAIDKKTGNVQNYDNGTYGSASFYISEDGTEKNQFYVYRAYYLGNKKWVSGAGDILQVGDDVIIYGKLTNYNGTAETQQNEAYLYSLNGKTEGDDTPETPVTPITGDNLLTNGDFETWTNGQPDNWKSTNTASSATLSQSTEAHGGSYSVKVARDANGKDNKRLAYKELKLKTGSYGVSFYVKASEATASINPGYTTVTDKVNYNYNGYVNNISTEWQQVSYNFTLSAETEVNLVVMIPKNSAADVIIDDFTLATSDGGIVDGGNDTPATPDTPAADAIYSVNFKANGQGDWTIDNKTIPTELTNIWTYNNSYGMVATAYEKSSSTNYDSEAWLISPAIDLSAASSATLKIHQAINFFTSVDVAKTQAAVMISEDGTNWTELTLSGWPTKLSWTFFDSTADLSAFAGKSNIKLALKYTSTAEKAGTWEVETITIE